MQSWLVTVEYRSPGSEILIDDPRLEACEELLREHMGQVRAGVDGDEDLYCVAIMVDAPTAGAALDVAADLVGPAAHRAGLPAWPIVRSEQVREEELKRSPLA